MKQRFKMTPQMEQDVISIFKSYPDTKAATKRFNDKWGTDFVERSLQQRYSNYIKGFKDGAKGLDLDKELALLAEKELKILNLQKRNTMLRSEAHKVAKEKTIKDLIIDEFKEHLKNNPINLEYKQIYHKLFFTQSQTYKSKLIIDFIISDLHFNGSIQDENHLTKIFDIFRDEIRLLNRTNDLEDYNIRLVFLGDEIEGSASHPISQQLENSVSTIYQVTKLTKLLIEHILRFKKTLVDYKHNNLDIVFVPYSNHGLVNGHGKERYKMPQDDMGIIMFEMLKLGLPNINFIKPDEQTYSIQTEDTVYAHGHANIFKSKLKIAEVFGVNKDIFLGHLHHYKEEQERNRVVCNFGAATNHQAQYSNMAGYLALPEVTIVKREKNIKHVKRIKI